MQRLIDRQTSLLRHLTSETLIFGTDELTSKARHPDLHGMDIGRLRLEAEFSYSKRMSRIRQTFERTATLLGHHFSLLTRSFASACPPVTYERYPDAKCFFDHLMEHWADNPSVPAWALDVAAIELALARARTLHPTAMEENALVACPTQPAYSWYRVHPCVALVRCHYDVRSLFEPARSSDVATEWPTCVAVLASRTRRRPIVIGVAPDAFMLLESSTEWSPLEPERASKLSAADFSRRDSLVWHLVTQGLMLVRRQHDWDGDHG